MSDHAQKVAAFRAMLSTMVPLHVIMEVFGLTYEQVQAALASPPAPAEGAREAALKAIRALALKHKCVDRLCCADAKCRDAGHHDEHEVTSDGEGWCCGHDECQCAPACSGFAPGVCPEMRLVQEIVATVDAALAAPRPPSSPDPARPARKRCMVCEDTGRVWFEGASRPCDSCAGRAGRTTP